ncbi:sugar-binding domain-containing protein, partial [Weissella confusa]
DLVRKGLYAEPSMQRALTVARNMDFLVTALGTPASLDSISIWNNNWHSIFPTTRREDIAGYIYGRPYDENGNILNIQNDKIVGLSLDEIMSVPRRVALAQDKSKSLAIRGALRGHLITELIMSESVAFRVLSESKADVLIEQLKQL